MPNATAPIAGAPKNARIRVEAIDPPAARLASVQPPATTSAAGTSPTTAMGITE